MTSVLLFVNEAGICQQLITNIAWDELQLRLVGWVSDKKDVRKCIERLEPELLVTVHSTCALLDRELIRYIEEGSETEVVVLPTEDFDNIRRINEVLEKREVICLSEYIRGQQQRSTYLLAKKAAQYIDNHYMEKLNVDKIASAIYLSSGYLMTIFKKEMGVSVIAYLTNKRIEKAKELLKAKNVKICDIAEAVGYTNTTFFSATFHKKVGQSPREYREHYGGTVEVPANKQ